MSNFRKDSNKVFITPIDQPYLVKEDNESSNIFENNIELQSILDDLEKDYNDEYFSDENPSTKSTSPVQKIIYSEKENLQDLFEEKNKISSFIIPNKKSKLIQTSNFMKKNWTSKLSNFKHTARSKILSKINFQKNYKINGFNLNYFKENERNEISTSICYSPVFKKCKLFYYFSK